MQQQEERIYDVIIAGGGPAGLSCALILGRCGRKVIVFDTGLPRNDKAHAMNGFISRDGAAPHDFFRQARSELVKYDVQWKASAITEAKKTAAGFMVYTEQGERYYSRKMVLATGVRDILPAIPGIDSFYGKSIFHCAYCDGWEVRNKPLALYALRRAGAVEVALSLQTWSRDITLLAADVQGLTKKDISLLQRNGIKICTSQVKGLSGSHGQLNGIVLQDNSLLPVHAMFFSTGSLQHSDLATQLECRCNPKGVIEYNRFQQTSVEGLFIAGDMAKDVQLIIVAAAEGAKAAVMINTVLNREQRLK